MKRSELYTKVWSTPVRTIAREVGLSDTRVATICRRHHIPLPPRGHWAKVAAGKQVPLTPLPNEGQDYEIALGQSRTRVTSSDWLVPGVLRRPAVAEEGEDMESASTAPASVPAPPPVAHSSLVPPRAQPPSDAPSQVLVDLELAHAIAADLQRAQSIRSLLAAVVAQAMHAPAGEARAVMEWAAIIEAKLAPRDPVSRVIALVVDSRSVATTRCS